jgi:S-adenosylmethionine-dependent methyltransferase
VGSIRAFIHTMSLNLPKHCPRPTIFEWVAIMDASLPSPHPLHGRLYMNAVESYYDENARLEWERFDRHPMEFAITRRALAEHLPPPPARILDCGGGPGRYAILLAGQGYPVTLLDLSSGNLALARKQAAAAGVEIEASVHGNALDLSAFADASFDAVLLMGPLYHLLREAERQQAVCEALRVLRPGGPLFAAFITMYAPFRDNLARGCAQDMMADEAVMRTLLERQAIITGFTDAWCIYPAHVRPLMEGAGAHTLDLLSAEGLSAGFEPGIHALNAAELDAWADLNYRFCRDPHLLGAADHILYVGTK